MAMERAPRAGHRRQVPGGWQSLLLLMVAATAACRTYSETGYCEKNDQCDTFSCNVTTKQCNTGGVPVQPVGEGAPSDGGGPDVAAGDATKVGGAADGASAAEAAPQPKICDVGVNHCLLPTPACDETAKTCRICTDTYCQGMPSTPACAPLTGCVECTASTNCTASGATTGKSVCDTQAQKCVECNGSGDCATSGAATGKAVCDAQKCVECSAADTSACKGAKPLCVADQCVQCWEMDDKQCTGNTPVCETANNSNSCRACNGDPECQAKKSGHPACVTDVAKDQGSCVECTQNGHCAGMSVKQVCDGDQRVCVECLEAKDCKTPSKPICAGKACHACKKDKDCADAYPDRPGLCLLDTGRCATDNDVLSIEGSSCTVTGMTGNVRCMVQPTIDDAIARGKAAVLLIGSGPFDGFAITASGATLVVAGRAGARITPVAGTAPGASVTGAGAVITIQDLEISGGTYGVSASSGTLNVRRCLIHDNAGSGIYVVNSAFDIDNTVVAGNGGGTASPGVTLGQGNLAKALFVNNTVIANGTFGVACADAFKIIGSIVAGNGDVALSANCAKPYDSCITQCSANIDSAQLTSNNYLLSAKSPPSCMSAINTQLATDRLGGPRPQGGKSDCGADEY